MAAEEPARPLEVLPSGKGSCDVVTSQQSQELVFGIVGHVGSGTSTVANTLKELLEGGFEVTVLKARDVIKDHADKEKLLAFEKGDINRVKYLQDIGDSMRSGGDHAAVAKALVGGIRGVRVRKQGGGDDGGAIVPDGTPRAYILDSLRHPAEVELLRRVYDAAFALVGVVCDAAERQRRLGIKFNRAGIADAKSFMDRDAKDSVHKHGQRVSGAFHLADYFVDNSTKRFEDDGETSNVNWDVSDQLERLVDIITHDKLIRPTAAESAMYAASGAQARSACLSRQVGACIVDENGSIIAVGTNEVPRSGGGVYGDGFEPDGRDGRCAYRQNKRLRHCSNTREQQKIASELVESLGDVLSLDLDATTHADIDLTEWDSLRAFLADTVLKSRVGQLLEFSRAVHAEMEALLRAARMGRSALGAKVFVTTYPCHYCARHLVAAGVSEVHYIEPYPKSLATELHSDSIEAGIRLRAGPEPSIESRVKFYPFTGVAPRLYSRAFVKDRDLKGEKGEVLFGNPEWGSAWDLAKMSYVQLEVILASPTVDTDVKSPAKE